MFLRNVSKYLPDCTVSLVNNTNKE